MREIPREIIERAALGDMGAFEEIYKVFSPAVYTIAFNVTRNRQDSEEAAQDVFVKVFRSLGDFKYGSSFGTWIYRIAVNTAINIYHNRARHRQKTTSFDEIEDFADPGIDPSKDKIERDHASSKIADLLKHLSPEHRSCIVLREIEGLDYKDIAEVLGIPLNTVRSRLKRAREALVAFCRKEGARGL